MNLGRADVIVFICFYRRVQNMKFITMMACLKIDLPPGVRAMDWFLKLPGFMASAWCAWSSAWRISLRRLGELLPVPWRLRVEKVDFSTFPGWVLVTRVVQQEFFVWPANSQATGTRQAATPAFPTAAHNEAMFVDATLSGLKYNDVPRRIWRFWQIHKGCRFSPR